MSIQTVTDPIILDSTGQSIITALNNLTEAVQPTNVCVDISTSLPASGWSSSAPYVQIWTNNKVSDECAVKVEFLGQTSNTGVMYLEAEKIAGGVRFTAPVKPTVALPVIVHIINAEAESITSISADMVSTSAVSGAGNVDEALAEHEQDISTLNGNITALSNALIANQQNSGTMNGSIMDNLSKLNERTMRMFLNTNNPSDKPDDGHKWGPILMCRMDAQKGFVFYFDFTNGTKIGCTTDMVNIGWT